MMQDLRSAGAVGAGDDQHSAWCHLCSWNNMAHESSSKIPAKRVRTNADAPQVSTSDTSAGWSLRLSSCLIRSTRQKPREAFFVWW